MMDQGWYSGHIFGLKKILIIATIISLLIFPISYIMINLPHSSISNVIGKSNEILFPCHYYGCFGRGVWNVTNGSPTLKETVNVTYTCDCNASVTFHYYPLITTNGTVSQPVIPSGQTMTIVGDAYRYSGNGNVTVIIGVTP